MVRSTSHARIRPASARSARGFSSMAVAFLSASLALGVTVGVGVLTGDVAGMFTDAATALGH